jgi:hypothetical protein
MKNIVIPDKDSLDKEITNERGKKFQEGLNYIHRNKNILIKI